ncbi:acetyl esterase [Pelomonas aquatica]|uniref:Acetyl esterase n=1 Tax=Pelomonas aquatica TaxID=431058 RepID=A0ABU1ZG44_9BURK|nr:alpha/beta hydrolase [Pelomonas aquatica]MDR7299423.1 acetyl esterase [Pelomonas aquatica]
MLDLHLKHVLAQAAGAPDLSDLPPEACRGLYHMICTAATAPPADVSVTPHETSFAGQAVNVRIYKPHGATAALPVTLYFHGGGFVLGDLEGYDAVCRQLCADSGVMIVSAAYRLAPEHPYPAAIDDCHAALGWVAESIRSFGGDPTRLAVAGDSAGATLATTTALLARDAGGPVIAFQLLVYPAAAGGHDGDYPSRQRHAAGPTLTLRTMDYFNRHYYGPAGKAPDWRGAPLLAPSLAGLPPTLLVLAAHDALRDEGMAYGEALAAAGDAVTVVEYHGLAHGFISMAGAVPAARLALAQMASALQQVLQP